LNLSKIDLIEIHNRVQQRFNATAGIKDEGLLDSIAERPDQIIYGKIRFPTICSKAASLMEALIRWHPFIDGNKRTGLLAVQTYLEINGYFSLLPLQVVRFSVNIAKTRGQDQKTIDKLINDIAIWLEQYVTKRSNVNKIKKNSKIKH
jgi:death-on-curing protein